MQLIIDKLFHKAQLHFVLHSLLTQILTSVQRTMEAVTLTQSALTPISIPVTSVPAKRDTPEMGSPAQVGK